MAEFFVLGALTAPHPTERQWIIRCAAEVMCKEPGYRDVTWCPRVAKAAAIVAAGQLATDAPLYLADLSAHAWARLAADIITAANWAVERKWSF